MHYFYGRVNRGHVACPLYGGFPYLGVSVMGGSTVVYCEHLYGYYSIDGISRVKYHNIIYKYQCLTDCTS